MKTKRMLAVLTAITAIGAFSTFSAYAEDTTEPETQAVTEASTEAETESPAEETTEAVTTTAPAETSTEAVTTDDDDDFDMPGGELCNECEFKLGNESFIALTYTLDSTGDKMYIGFAKGSIADRENASTTNLKNIEVGTKSDEKAENFFTVKGDILTINKTGESYKWDSVSGAFVKQSSETVSSTTSSTASGSTTTTTTTAKSSTTTTTTKKADSSKSDSPKTGDSFGGVLALLALAGGTAFASRRKNK